MRSLLLFAFLGSLQLCSAQDKITFLNDKGKEVKEKNATILQHRRKLNDTLWLFDLYTNRGPLIVSFHTSDEEGKDLNGYYNTYTIQGELDTAGEFSHGKRNGEWTVFKSAGNKPKLLSYKQGVFISTKSIQVRQSDNTKKSTDSPYSKTFNKILIDSEFPGGASGWIQYLNHHQHYPDEAVKNMIQGTCRIGFIIDKEGNVEKNNIWIDKSTEFHLDQEAIRVISESPTWKPAEENGKPVRSYKKQPIVFKLSPR